MTLPILVCCVYDDRSRVTVGSFIWGDGFETWSPEGELAFNEPNWASVQRVCGEHCLRVTIKSIFMSGRSLRHPPITTFCSRAAIPRSAHRVPSKIGIALKKDMTMQSYKTHNDL